MSADRVIKQFVDTNILVYAFDASAGKKYTQASQLIQALWENGNGCLSIQVLQELYVNITRKIANPVDSSTAKQIIADLSQWRMHTPDSSNLLRAIDLLNKYKLSFWDAMVVESAISLGCKQLISEDFTHGRRFGDIQVINPFIDETL
jgi:predicted nucleic acid-binding protein